MFASAGKASVFKLGDFLSFCLSCPPTDKMSLLLQVCGHEGQREVQLQRLAEASAHGPEGYGEAPSGGG